MLKTNKSILAPRALALALPLICAGCVAAPIRPAAPVPELRTAGENSALGVGDIFDVRVFGETELNGKYRIGTEGTIEFPLIGTLRVAGLLPSQIGVLIAARLRDGLIRSPQVSIFVVEQVSKKVHILGQVAKPGTFAYTPGMNIVEAITQAGGFTPLSSKNSTTVTRNDNGKQTIFRVRAGDISDGTAANFSIRPGDIISVPERFF